MKVYMDSEFTGLHRDAMLIKACLEKLERMK
jgi:hypothetical protein